MSKLTSRLFYMSLNCDGSKPFLSVSFFIVSVALAMMQQAITWVIKLNAPAVRPSTIHLWRRGSDLSRTSWWSAAFVDYTLQGCAKWPGVGIAARWISWLTG